MLLAVVGWREASNDESSAYSVEQTVDGTLTEAVPSLDRPVEMWRMRRSQQ
jgi:hypothetical protein